MTSERPNQLYLDLLKRTVTNYVYGSAEMRPLDFASTDDQRQASRTAKGALKRALARAGRSVGLQLMVEAPFDPSLRERGADWSPLAHTMIGMKRLDNVQECVETILEEDVPGDLVETGVWRGGASILMKGVLKAWGCTDRRLFVADSFQGLPPPDAEHYPDDAPSRLHEWDELAVSVDEVRRNFERYGLLDDQVVFLEGWFKDTLPAAPIEQLAVMRLDGDLYESTMDALTHLYPKLSPGGFVIVDDYGDIPPCRKAVHDYRDRHGIDEKIVPIDERGIFWRRER
jgi:hypothetical protein